MSPPLDKFRVLWVYQTVKDPHGIRIEAGQKPSLCFKGRTHMVCVAAGHPVRVIKRPAQDFDSLRVVFHGKEEHRVSDAVARLREIADRNGITKGARLILDKASGSVQHDLDDEAFNNEEDDMAQSETPAPVTDGEPTNKPTIQEITTVKTKTSKKADAKKVPAKGGPKAPTKARQAAPEGAKKKAAPKPSPKEKSAKKAQPGDGLGREGTLSRFMAERLVKGESPEKISEAAKKAFPDSASTETSHVSWIRWRLTSKGLLKPAKK